MDKDSWNCGGMFHDWFYLMLLVLIGLVLLAANLGFISHTILAYWPVLLIVIALKEIIERH